MVVACWKIYLVYDFEVFGDERLTVEAEQMPEQTEKAVGAEDEHEAHVKPEVDVYLLVEQVNG